MDFNNVNPFIRYANSSHETSGFSPRYAYDCRIFCLLSGTADVYTADTHFVMRPSSILFVAAGNMYNLVCNGANLTRINFDFDQSNSDISTPFVAKNTDYTLSDEKHKSFIPEGYPPYIFIEGGGRCADDIGEIINEFMHKRVMYQEISSAILKKLLVKLYRIVYGSNSKIPDTLVSVIRYINDNYSSPISTRMLLDISGYSERHLNRLFVTYTGVSLHKHIINRRMEEASYLLIHTDLSIASVSERVGFTNISNFSVAFKAHSGLTPSGYRKKFANLF